ncbi:MAG: spore maturation protein [Bacilli bacterium]|nr:spore maturation protein [Bacilli bacterium]
MIVLNLLSAWALPIIVAVIIGIGYFRKVPLYDTFVQGAREGIPTVLRILPHLVAMMVAVQVFRNSGVLDDVLRFLSPVLQRIGIPAEIVPMALLRSISGSGSLAVMTDIFRTQGTDSFVGKMASILQGSSDTTLYVLTVYFGSVGIRQSRYALKVGLLADFAAVSFSIIAAYFFFS